MKILAALDFGDSSLDALVEARALAHRVGGTLAACHVLPAHQDLRSFLTDAGPDDTAEHTGEEEAARRHLIAHAREKLGLELTEVHIVRGSPYAEIVRCGENVGADFIVIGTHGRTGLARAVLGSVAELVVRHAHCTVLVARPVRKPGVVLAATDLSPASLPVIAAGAAAAKGRGARLVLTSVLELQGAFPSSAGAMLGAMPAVPPLELQQQLQETMQRTLAQALERASVEGEVRVLMGSAASEIVAYAEELEAELVVVGTHGRTGLSRLALGSVAERIVRSVSCSVLAVRPAAAS